MRSQIWNIREAWTSPGTKKHSVNWSGHRPDYAPARTGLLSFCAEPFCPPLIPGNAFPHHSYSRSGDDSRLDALCRAINNTLLPLTEQQKRHVRENVALYPIHPRSRELEQHFLPELLQGKIHPPEKRIPFHPLYLPRFPEPRPDLCLHPPGIPHWAGGHSGGGTRPGWNNLLPTSARGMGKSVCFHEGKPCGPGGGGSCFPGEHAPPV